LLLSGPGCCSRRRRLPGGASSRYRQVRRRRRGRPCQQPSPASVAGVQHAVSTHPVSASGIRRSSRPVSGHLGSSSRRSGGRPSAVHPSGVQPSGVCSVRPDASVSSHLRRWRWGPDRGGRATVTTGRVEAPVAAGPAMARSTVEEAGTRATLPKSGGRWRARAAGWVRAAAAALAAERPGRPGRRAEPVAAALWARGAGCSTRWLHPPRSCRPRAGCATTVRGRRRA
jgi:hypothetical protein